MSKELKMEVFASKEPVKSVRLHVYEFHTSELYENKYRLIRSAAWKIRNVNACGVFEDGSYIYTTEKISEEIPNVNFRLTYLGEQELGVLEHKKVYSELIKHWIIQKLRTVKIQKNSKEYYKYACRSNVTSRWIQTEQGFQTFYSGNRQISLERKYNFTVKILDDGRAYLKIDTSSVFLSNQTVYDYITQGMNPIGMEVKNEWGKNNQTGILTEICDYTVVDKIDFADSLKAYYTDMKKEGYRVENLPDQTPVVRVELQAGKIYPYYPQALKPVLTREKVGQIDARFSMTIEKYIKRDMITRIELDKDFIRDIGSIAQLGDLEFENDMCNVKELGYLKGKVESPALTCGQGKRLRCGEEFKVFNYGFYQKPDEKIKIGYIYPKNTVDLIKAVVNGICEFAAYGKYQGEKDAYIIPGLLDIQMKPMIKEEYELGDITDYKRAAQRLRKVEGIDIVIGIVPDGMDEDGPYNPFKTIWAEANIPSQMISMKTAQLFYRGKREGNKSKYYLHNIVLGILGKTGGIPWVIKEMPGNVDCFVGLDVATLEKGIHYPACSVVFDKSGRLLGFYKPKSAQRGEKIETRILQDIFDQVLLSYEEKFGEQPKNIMIHRDGFSNENDAWYEKYFGAKGIAYTIVEVRKNISSKLAIIEDGVIKNPEMGYCIYNNNKGYLVTTNMKNKTGANAIVQDKYVTISINKKSVEDARTYFARVGADLIAHFARLGSKCVELETDERLRIVHDFFRVGEETAYHFNIKETRKKGHDFKDYVCPDTMEFEKDYFKMGNRYGRVLFLREYASYIKDSMVAELTDLNRNLMMSIDIVPVPTDEAVREAESRLLGVETNITNWQRKQNQNNNFSATVPYDMEQQKKEMKEFLDDLTTRDQRMMFAVLTMVHTADSKEQLDNDTEALLTTARKHLCQFAVLKYQQMDGLNTAMPFGTRKIDAFRTLTTESLAVFIPFRVQDIYHENGIYYGQNVISKNMIIADRRQLLNGNSFILGVSGGGKSFAAKGEIENIILSSNADVIIIDPEREYSQLVKALGGEIINISATSPSHINAMDMNKEYGDGANPVILKSEFIMSLCEQLIGGTNLGAKQKSIIDRCTASVYRDYQQRGYTGTVPTLQDFRAELLKQDEPEAKEIALAIELFTHGSLNTFAKPTNVDTDNRLICYDILDLGKQLMPIGMLVVLDSILNRITQNRAKGKQTFIFIDEIYLLFQHEYSANFLFTLWKRVRKYGASECEAVINAECIYKLMKLAGTEESIGVETLDDCAVQKIIGWFQQQEDIDLELRSDIEFIYLPMLDDYSEVRPRALNTRLSLEPEYFCSLIELFYKK